jgi:hypothetical protein
MQRRSVPGGAVVGWVFPWGLASATGRDARPRRVLGCCSWNSWEQLLRDPGVGLLPQNELVLCLCLGLDWTHSFCSSLLTRTP